MHTGQIQEVKPIQGSVSQPSIEELATRYVQIMERKDFHEHDVYKDAYDIIEEIARRIGHENARAAINRAKEIYKLLTGA